MRNLDLIDTADTETRDEGVNFIILEKGPDFSHSNLQMPSEMSHRKHGPITVGEIGLSFRAI